MNTNTYRHTFFAKCPANGIRIEYQLRIDVPAHQQIRVELIVAVAGAIRSGYHEEIADILQRKLGGAQVLTAFHHGVGIETRRSL